MRELVYYVATTLDGRIAAPDGDFTAIPVVGDHIEMIKRDWVDTLPAPALDHFGLTADNTRFSTVLMGWNTYAAGLPHVRDPYPHLEQIVFSRTRGPADVPDGIRVTDEDPAEVVRALRDRPGPDVWLCGGGLLASALIDEIDRLVLKVNPLVFGSGVPLFDTAYDPRAFELVRSTRYGSGVVVNDLRRIRPT